MFVMLAVVTDPISQPGPLLACASPPTTTLIYERTDEQLRAHEAAAVWRVVWWIGLLWSIGTILSTWPTLWTLLSGAWAESRLAELRFGTVAAALSVLQCAGAVVLVGALLSNARRRVIAILATLMSVLLLLSEIARLMIGGVYFERSFHLVWLGAIGIRMLFRGAILVVAMFAWWLSAMSPTRLFVAVAVLLLGWPAGQVIDPLYWWLARGEPLAQVLRNQFSSQYWPSMLEAGLLLLVGMLFIVMPSSFQSRRWLLAIAALLATLAINSHRLWLLENFSLYWKSGGFQWLYTMFADGLRDAAPVLGLLAWRPVRDLRP